MMTHKIALKPTARQTALLVCAVGVARFSYNWVLAEWKRRYEAGEKPSEHSLRRQLNAVKREAFPWMLEVPKSVVQQAIKNLGRAFSNFFSKRSKYPRFHRRGQHDSARFDNGPGTFTFDGKRVKLPVIGWVRLQEELRFYGKPLSATVSRVADRWFVSVPVEIEVDPPDRENQAAVGVDFGLSTFAALSTGEKIEAPKPLRRALGKLRRLSRALARKKKGSSNRRKAAAKLAKLHAHISNIRADFLHKFTTGLVRRFTAIGVEDLHVRGMLRNHCLARAIIDVGWVEARRQLEYKAPLVDSKVMVADRWFPSSKTCSDCGSVVESLPLSVREWCCPSCGVVHDRDVNAAKNLKPTAVSYTVAACGEEGSGGTPSGTVKPASVKQESLMYHLIQE